jgi:hypothetical protein
MVKVAMIPILVIGVPAMVLLMVHLPIVPAVTALIFVTIRSTAMIPVSFAACDRQQAGQSQ